MRIITRGDFDGMTSSLLVSVVETVDGFLFAHPKDVQEGAVQAGPEDIVINLPYIPGCGLWFDHHAHQDAAIPAEGTFKGRFEIAPSCARVIVNHYADQAEKFAPYQQLLEDTDRLDSAQLTRDDVLRPEGGILLGLTLDPRTGVGREFREYFQWMVARARDLSIPELLNEPEVKSRVDAVMKAEAEYRAILQKHAVVDGSVVRVDFRDLAQRPVGSRFIVFAMYPDANVEVRIFKGFQGVTVAAIGHSIFNRTCQVSAGALCARYGGGGHRGAGTCQFPDADAERIVAEIVETLKRNEPLAE